jgi:hypothetical protein
MALVIAVSDGVGPPGESGRGEGGLGAGSF